jgi:hypothetical protein
MTIIHTRILAAGLDVGDPLHHLEIIASAMGFG